MRWEETCPHCGKDVFPIAGECGVCERLLWNICPECGEDWEAFDCALECGDNDYDE